MDSIRCVHGHELPDNFHHGPEEEREPCPTCGSTGRAFGLTLADTLSVEDTITVTKTVSTSWTTYSQQRPDAVRAAHTYSVEVERLEKTYLVRVLDDVGSLLGGGVADELADAALAVAMTVEEALKSSEGPHAD